MCSSRKLKRFKSFHGFPAAKKQITVPVEKKAKKVAKVFKRNFNLWITWHPRYRVTDTTLSLTGGLSVCLSDRLYACVYVCV